jgi:NAD(P)H-dependent flavin oxidoreductase YrpB (nitropropane dioxygenase family)
MISTRFTDSYGITHPIAQAGMAFVGMTPSLAVAVCAAGGLGSIGTGLMPPAALKATIDGVRAGTSQPFNVNLITGLMHDGLLEVVCNEGVPVVSFHWGHPARSWIDALHGAGAKVWEQVGSADAAKKAVDDGVDLVIAQGSEAGGHNLGTLPIMALLPLVVDAAAPALVLGAGGIADGRGLAAALMLGADGVWVGTRFVATTESAAHPEYKARLAGARGADTVTTHLFGRDMPEFNPMRVLRNRVVEQWHERVDEIPARTGAGPVIGHISLPGLEMDLPRFSSFVPVTATTGDLDEMPLLAGQGVGLIESVRPAAEVISAMVSGATAIIQAVGARTGIQAVGTRTGIQAVGTRTG